jgi:hypothetical protein
VGVSQSLSLRSQDISASLRLLLHQHKHQYRDKRQQYQQPTCVIDISLEAGILLQAASAQEAGAAQPALSGLCITAPPHFTSKINSTATKL